MTGTEAINLTPQITTVVTPGLQSNLNHPPIRKIVSVKNVGKFRNSAGKPNPELARHVLIFGANGFGKTTLCAILRSLQTGDASHVTGRKTLGVAESTEIELLTATGNVKFNGSSWTKTMPEVAIFDGAFVAENVHSGDVVDLEHKRNLYRVIVGQQGVTLAEEEARLAGESRTKTTELSVAGKALQTHIHSGIKLPDFLKLAPDPDIDAKIAEQTKTVEAIRQIEQIISRSALIESILPSLPDNFQSLLGQTLEGIAGDAERQMADHLAQHSMAGGGEAWLAEGIEYATEDCPFCGQDIQDSSLIKAYRSVFSDTYGQLKSSINNLRVSIEQDFGDGVIGRLSMQRMQNQGAMEFWQRYCTFSDMGIHPPENLDKALLALRKVALNLIDKKAMSPLEPVTLDDEYSKAMALYMQAKRRVDEVNKAIRDLNSIISARKKACNAGNLKTAEAELNNMTSIKKRYDLVIDKACADYKILEDSKNEFDKAKAAVRAQLEKHTNKIVRPYEKRINEYLDAFNAGFQITETKHHYPGGVATSSYELVINNTSIDIGDGKTLPSIPSFKNTLSSGDRSTLALAFFLAHLEHDQNLSNRIVIFDDPFNSQDAFRRQQTVFQIKKVAQACAQVIILSHDASFLRLVWSKFPTDQRIALQIADHRSLGSKIVPCDLEDVCRGRVATEIDDLLLFYNTAAGKPHDIIKKMRIVLESYCRATYTSSFDPTDMLGGMVEKIRNGGEEHPACALLDELDQINDYSREAHHGDNPTDGTADLIDMNELTGFVRRTLKVVNALQA